MHCNIIAVPGMVQLSLTGAYEVLSRTPGWSVHVVSASPWPLRTSGGLRLLPDVTREQALPSDILLIPGGDGIELAMLDAQWLSFIQREAARARYVVSVCSGSLLLGATGFLKGRRAGGHWQSRALLAQFGAIACDERVTIDGNIYSSGGVTSGIDMILRLVGDVEGDTVAKSIQLAMEHDPVPPYAGGTPFNSHPDIVRAVNHASQAKQAGREKLVSHAVGNRVFFP